MSQVFIPANSIEQITTKHMLSRLKVATLNDPGHICGIARRIGYTGKQAKDLAIYRLKLYRRNKILTTLSTLFVVDKGMFVDYEQWKQKQAEEDDK